MTERELETRIAQMEDVELMRMLTVNSEDFTDQAFDVAHAEALKRGLPIDKALLPTARPTVPGKPRARFEVEGIPVICNHCDGETFLIKGETLLNTRVMSFLKLDWLNSSATTMVCTRCGSVQFFAVPPAPTSTPTD